MKKFLLLLLFTILPAALSAQEQDYLWPTSASNFLSSTFGETRTAHFHAGLDIKTWGREGYDVYATKDGYVQRIGISARGYGKVIYLMHEDSSYSLYAHLQSFSDPIQAYADSIRLQDFRFELDHVLPENRIKVKQGDVIGISGSSGIGPPHLHFEIRRPNENPFNALSTNLKVQDNRPPVMHSLLVEPLSNHTRIEADFKPRILRPEWNKKGYFDFGEITFTGDVGLALDVYDEADEVYNKYAAYELLLLSGSDTLFHSRLDEYDYEHSSDMFLDRTMDPNTGRRRFQRLYYQPALEVAFAKPEFCGCLPDSGYIDLTLIAKDYYENTTKGRIRLIRAEDEMIFNSTARILNEKLLQQGVWGDNWINTGMGYIHFGFHISDPFNPTLNPYDSTRVKLLRNKEGTEFLLWEAKPDSGLVLHSADHKFTLRFDPGTYFKYRISLMPFWNHGRPVNELMLYPQDYISKNKFTIEYYIDENEAYADQLALFKYNRFKDRWEFFDAERVGNTLIGRNNEFGLYKALPDTLPPEIGKADIFRNESGQWLIRLEVTDEGTGIRYQRAVMKVNGQQGIAEYDKEDDYLIYYHPDFIPKKSNRLEVEIGDHVGNTSTVVLDVNYSAAQR